MKNENAAVAVSEAGAVVVLYIHPMKFSDPGDVFVDASPLSKFLHGLRQRGDQWPLRSNDIVGNMQETGRNPCRIKE